MGKPVNIAKFVRRIVRNYGYLDNFNQKIKINYIGLRKGESFMRNFIIKNIQKKYQTKKCFRNKPTRKSFNDLKNLLNRLKMKKIFIVV